MFRFVYVTQPNETINPANIDGLVGVESNDGSPDGVPVAGVRVAGAGEIVAAVGRRPAEAGVVDGGYVVVPADAGRPAYAFGKSLHDLAEGMNGRLKLLVENGPGYQTPLDLWTLLEAARHPAIGVALDIDAARAAGQSAGVLIPTLNLRIGLVRVRTEHDDVAGYARRLAGVGFEGLVVLDPPAGPDRVGRAQALAAIFRSIFPTKPAKKTPALKPVAGKST